MAKVHHGIGQFLALLATLASVPIVSGAAEAPSDFGLNAIAIGASSRADLAIGMIEARATLSPHVAITVAPTILAIEGGDTEHQLRTGFTLSAPLGRLHLDDRNMWVFSDAGTTRFRNRLRLAAPVELGAHTLRLQLLDEIFYEEGRRGWFRNMYGVGVGLDISRSVSVDAYFTQQDDLLEQRNW